MNAVELKVARKLLGLSVQDAAKYICMRARGTDVGVSPKTWMAWESAKKNIPDDVELLMVQLIGERNSSLLDMESLLKGMGSGCHDVTFYSDFSSFLLVKRELEYLDWVVYQSSVSELYARYPQVSLVV